MLAVLCLDPQYVFFLFLVYVYCFKTSGFFFGGGWGVCATFIMNVCHIHNECVPTEVRLFSSEST